jgi:hypothetical protein
MTSGNWGWLQSPILVFAPSIIFAPLIICPVVFFSIVPTLILTQEKNLL